uniref:Si:ch73-335m24.2 n=1 Tax=Xiphophorus couchianus TaxID=32473 RepID=A0A3B5MCY4_9TELE
RKAMSLQKTPNLINCFLQISCILKNHTAHACEGDLLVIKCPSRTSVAVLSAFYGRRVPYKHLCSAPNTNITCLSAVALRKVSRRCHGRENCSIFADTQTFGDPCFPGTRKHLRVSFTCEHNRLLIPC